MRYRLARLLYRLRFPQGDLRVCDFRPHFDGFLINTHVAIELQPTPELTRDLAFRRWAQMLRLLRHLRPLFARGDKVQMVVGFKNPLKQLLKGWVDVSQLHNVDSATLSAIKNQLGEMVEWDETTAAGG